MPRAARFAPKALWFLAAAAAAVAAAPRDPLKVPKSSILVTTTIEAGGGLSATLTEFFTGEKNEKTAIDLLLGLYRADGTGRTLLVARDYNAEAGGHVSRGSLGVIDLDCDGTNEILVNYHHNERPGATRVDLDVLRVAGGRLLLAWSGPIRVDTTGPGLSLPADERERYTREVGYMKTAAAQGRRIYFQKAVSVAAGVAFDPPRTLEEEFDLGPAAPAPPAVAPPSKAP